MKAANTEDKPINPPRKKRKTQKERLAELKEKLAAAEEEVEEYEDRMLRAEAEMQNVRKRAVREMENAHKFGAERLLERLLPITDSLENAVKTASSEPAMAQGIEICLKLLLIAITAEYVKQLDPIGEPFDPQFHEAMTVVEDAEAEPNTISMVIQKGYLLHDRLIRPAMVIVTKAPTDDN